MLLSYMSNESLDLAVLGGVHGEKHCYAVPVLSSTSEPVCNNETVGQFSELKQMR